MNPSVSVIIPAYRAAQTIGRAIESVLGQTRPPDEILVIDDGSPDNVTAALEPFGNRVTLIRQSNGGASGARNRGIDLAQGDFIAFLDADDYWEPNKLELQLDAFRRHPEVSLVGSRYFVQRPGGPQEPPPPDDLSFYDRLLAASPDHILDTILRFSTPTVMLRRKAIGTHRFDCHLKVAEDLDLWIRLLSERPAYIVSQPLTTMVLEPASLSRADPDVGYSPMIDVAQRYRHLVSPHAFRKFEIKVYRGWASAHLGQGHSHAALQPACRRLMRQPLSAQAWWIVGKCLALSCVERCRAASKPATAVVGQSTMSS